jgi:hypothetical protein
MDDVRLRVVDQSVPVSRTPPPAGAAFNAPPRHDMPSRPRNLDFEH